MIDIRKDAERNNSSNGIFKIIFIVLCVICLFTLLGRFFSEFFSFTEIKEIGEKYTGIFFKNIFAKAVIQLVWLAFLFVSVSLSFLFFRMNLNNISVDAGIFKKKRNIFLMSIVVSVIFSSAISSGMFEKYLAFANRVDFNATDPVFGKNIGYYVFSRPFFVSLVSSLYNTWIILSLLIFILYFVFMTMFSEYHTTDLFVQKSVGIHNISNLVILFVFKRYMYRFMAEELLYGEFGGLRGAGCTDKTVWLSYYRVMPFLLIAVSALMIFFFSKGEYKKTLKSFLVLPAVWIVTVAVSMVFQNVIVAPNEVVRESENIKNNIDATKAAFGLENIKEIDFNVENNLSVEDIKKYKSTLDSVRIIDLESNLSVLNQIQGIRNYYKFNETDIIPCNIDGKKTAVAVTAREISKDNLSDTSDTYINRKLRYTHGFGLVINPINQVTEQGQPEFYVKDIPPKSAVGITKITQPRIYFGELTDDYVIVGSNKYKELDYSEGQEDIEFTYDGKAGINLTLFNRVLFAAKYGDFRLLVSDMFSKDSKILINRNITERVKKIAPFFDYDTDPYIIINSEGRLMWVIDAYTKTNLYPYAQSVGGKNYIRNSAKVVIDAYNGSVRFYRFDENDPIAAVYDKIYPQLFEKTELPDDIKYSLKYPEYLFGVQSEMYAKYHIDNPTTFYNKNDLWVIAREKYGTANEERNVAPYYNSMKLEDGDSEELLLTIPYTLSNKDNMVSWLAVRNEYENYGQLYVYKFPKDINVYGPMQIENRINSDTEISSALTLWSQGGSKVIRGNLLVVPIKNSVIYVEPLYITSNNQSNLPELKQVIVAYNEKIVMKSSFSEALYALFGKGVPDEEKINEFLPVGTGDTGENISFGEAARAVIESYKKVKDAGAGGNWSDMGNSMNELENAVKNLENEINKE